jgi:hypothetical protein
MGGHMCLVLHQPERGRTHMISQACKYTGTGKPTTVHKTCTLGPPGEHQGGTATSSDKARKV